MNGCDLMRPIELQSGADQLLVAASAVRPPVSRRGRRSSVASRRRWISWQARSPGEVRRYTFPPISDASPPSLRSHSMANPETNRRLIVVVC